MIATEKRAVRIGSRPEKPEEKKTIQFVLW